MVHHLVPENEEEFYRKAYAETITSLLLKRFLTQRRNVAA